MAKIILTRETLSGVRDAAMSFLMRYQHGKASGEPLYQQPTLAALEALSRELNILREKLGGAE
jgi:hypothetical protein